MAVRHDRGELLDRLAQLEADPEAASFIRLALICELTDEQLCDAIQIALHALELYERNSGRFPTPVSEPTDAHSPV